MDTAPDAAPPTGAGTPRRAVRERGRARRQLLLEAALRVIARDGIAGVTHRAVAAEAGVAPSSATYFFDSIDDLISEAVRWAMAEELERLGAIQRAVAATDAPVTALIDHYADEVENDFPGHSAAQFEMYLLAARSPELQQVVAEIIEATTDVARDALKLSGIETPSASTALVALIDGLALHRIAAPAPEQLAALRYGLRALAVGFAALEHADAMNRTEVPAPRPVSAPPG